MWCTDNNLGGDTVKVQVETDQTISEPRLTLHVPADYPQLNQLVARLTKVSLTPATLPVSQHGQAVALPLTDIMFIEATGHEVAVHTVSNVYRAHSSLSALSTSLPANFQRVSKSAVVNVQRVYSLTKTLTGNLLAFHDSPKQLYVSRRFYRPLKLILEQRKS